MKRSDLLSINDPMWPKLEHAYGSAADIPDQLRILLKKGPFKKDYWLELWSSHCLLPGHGKLCSLPLLCLHGSQTHGQEPLRGDVSRKRDSGVFTLRGR